MVRLGLNWSIISDCCKRYYEDLFFCKYKNTHIFIKWKVHFQFSYNTWDILYYEYLKIQTLMYVYEINNLFKYFSTFFCVGLNTPSDNIAILGL